MRRTPAVLAALLALTAGLPPTAAAADPCPGGRVLNIVPHHDDDLLFLSPDLLQDLRGNRCVRTVFLVASDYHDQEYLLARERGVRVAYANVAGVPGPWTAEPYTAGGVTATRWRLGDGRITVVENRIPDDITAPAGQLWRLYADNTPLTTRPGDRNPPQRLDRTSLLNHLRAVVADYAPHTVRTLDPTADLHGIDPAGDFHRDHVATTRLVQAALHGTAATVVLYRDYTARHAPPNLSITDYALKRRAFADYAAHDRDICPPERPTPCPPPDSYYTQFLTRQHRADQTWTGDLVTPVPDSPATPRMGGAYRVVNRQTGLELAVHDAALDPGAPIVGWEDTGTPNQRFRLEATPQGWKLVATHSGLCVDLPESGREPGIGAIQFPCTDNPNQALRVSGDPATGFRLTFAHSGHALSMPGTDLGTPVTQAETDQRWDLVG
ncbi:RICIN domain-containing protein [Saccharothrix sp. NPDC042600]|uniref:RICIN domain-containing protein n=1 Tax=Saccharothrix TaxID=2071 RepID=UPI0033F589E1|nr:hypothetical protein GCM10017745_47830 [Saccharothrix mutabilis subsp. capreolus]